ncbi:MAG: SusD/RagB family nutrient-binding outer membrane lipoprotein [Bacteroidota bacterium]
MKNIKYIILIFSIVFSGCDYGDLNDNPNEPTDVPEILLLTGTMLADIEMNVSHIQRISGMWSGQYRGETLLYESLYNYVIASEESNSSWQYLYNGIIAQNNIIRNAMPDDNLIQGITKVVEAHAIGTAAANWGDIPFSQAVNVADYPDPVFDNQKEIFNQLQTLLDEAITNLSNTEGYTLTQDIFFRGNEGRWIEVAYTLKSRFYILTKEYDKAYTAALNGISSDSASMMFDPIVADDGSGIRGSSNVLWQFTSGTRAGYMSTNDTYLSNLLEDGSDISRNNAKTNEQARSNYYYIDEDGSKIGVGAPEAPMPLVTYQENLLNLAEASARANSFDEALGYLNDLRSFLASGDAFVKVNEDDILLYDDYEAGDFASGGMENLDGIDNTRALLREIIEERYISGYGTFIPWNDARRLRKSDGDVAVPFPLNTTSVTQYPERFIISQNEINSNSNAPTGLSIFDKTEVNQ